MISLRHHALSLAAVFLSLALGVVLGSGSFSKNLLSGLRDEKRDMHAQISGLDDQKNSLNEKLSAADNFDDHMAPRILHDALAGKSVMVFRTPDAQDDDVSAVSKFIGEAGGAVTGTVMLTQEFVNANSAAKLQSVVNSSILPAGQQLNTKLVDPGAQAGDLLGIVLMVRPELPPVRPDAPPPPTAEAHAEAHAEVQEQQRDTVLAALRDTGFLTYQPAEHMAPATVALVVTGGALPQDAGNQGVSVARFAAALAPHGAGALMAGRDGCANGAAAVAVARADAALSSAISTVDDVDSAPGRITAVLGLRDLINGGHVGQYGTGHGAASVTVPQ